MAVEQVLWSLRSINGVSFGISREEMLALLGEPSHFVQNPDGEVEFHYGGTIYRCFLNEFVECSFADQGVVSVDGIPVLSIFEWLAERNDVVDKARFRISLAHGIAYDYRFPEHGSITVFGRGRWDSLVSSDGADGI